MNVPNLRSARVPQTNFAAPEGEEDLKGERKAAPATRQIILSLCRRVFALLTAASWKDPKRVNEC